MAILSPEQQEFQDALDKFIKALKKYEEDQNIFARTVTIRRKKKDLELLDFVVNFTIFQDNVKEHVT